VLCFLFFVSVIINNGGETMQKWEYCVITGIDIRSGAMRGYYPRLYYLGLNRLLNNEKEVDLSHRGASQRPKGWENYSEAEYIAIIIAKLGSDGWEMVGTGNGNSDVGVGAHVIYFKRLLE
jgi:hypothetical protein